MNFFQRRAVLKDLNYLEVRPIRNYSQTVDENNLVTVLIPKFKNRFAVRFVLPYLKHSFFKLKLDEFGSTAWLLIDSKRNVGDIANELVNKFGERIHPVEERLTRFFTGIYEQRLITFLEIQEKGN
ncbi:MAG: PqqD family protein [Ignavibacteriaceae bacterium]|nr:PqqD family protein [Ignavibacteriaceae bacterium]